MAATPILCQDTTITVDDGAASPITINGVISITGIGSGSATEIDVTTLASSAKEFRQGLQDFGTIQLEVIRNQDDLGQAELFEIMGSQSVREFVVTLSSSTADVITFNAFVQSFSVDINADDAVRGTATLRITGAIVFS